VASGRRQATDRLTTFVDGHVEASRTFLITVKQLNLLRYWNSVARQINLLIAGKRRTEEKGVKQ